MTDDEIFSKYNTDYDKSTVPSDEEIASKYGIDYSTGYDQSQARYAADKQEIRNLAKAGLYGARNTATLGFYNSPEEAESKKNYPGAYGVGQVGAGVAMYPLGVAGAAKYLPAAYKVGKTTLGALGANSALGGVQGYNATDENGEEYSPEQRRWNAAKGAGFGGGMSVAGSAAGKIADVVTRTGRTVMPHAENVLRATAGPAEAIFNETKMEAIQRANKMYPGMAQQVFSDGKGGVTSNMKVINQNIDNLPKNWQRVIAANHETALNKHPIAQGASTPHDIQRQLVDLNQQNPQFNNSPARVGLEAGLGGLIGYGVNKAYEKATGNETGVLGNLLAMGFGGRAGVGSATSKLLTPITRSIAQKEANLAVLNRAATNPMMSEKASRGILPYAGGPAKKGIRGAGIGGSSIGAQLTTDPQVVPQDTTEEDDLIAAKYGLF